MTPILSVIIPVYNTENTLTECVESVVACEEKDIEIILVDDGSFDKCPEICNQWALRDKRIRTIHKVNGGLSDARNTGINISKGQLITFVDSDDYISSTTLSSLIAIMKEHPEYDILEYPVTRLMGNEKQKIFSPKDKIYTNMEKYWLEGEAYSHTYAWNKFYRKYIFDNVRFPKGYVFEDVWTLPLLLNNAKCVTTTRKGMYFYRYNEKGITANASAKEQRMLLEAHLKVLPQYINRQFFYRYYMHIVDIQIVDYEKNGDTPKLKTIRNLHLGNLSLKHKVKAIALNILGIKILCVLTKVLNQRLKLH